MSRSFPAHFSFCMKKIIVRLHLFLGLLSGVVVFIVSVSGALYAFEEEFRNAMYKELYTVQRQEQRKPIAELIRLTKKEFPKPGIKNIKYKNEEERSVEIILKNKLSVFIDPYSGKILGSVNKENDFFGTVLQLHRSLLMGDTGKVITGTSATVFIFMLISGIVLWWPRNRKALKPKLSISRNIFSRNRLYDLHSIFGFYASWIVIFMALTGIVWSFKWAENTMYWLAGSKKEERKHYESEIIKHKNKNALDIAIVCGNSCFPNTSELFIAMPEDSTGVFRITFRQDDGGFFKKTNQLFVDQYSGKLIKAQAFDLVSNGDRLKSNNYTIHTGKVFGITGQTIVFFAALISASLPLTGFLMWWRKRKRKKD